MNYMGGRVMHIIDLIPDSMKRNVASQADTSHLLQM